jgi:hypothetical protein
VQRGDYTISVWVSLDPDFHMNQGILDDSNAWAIGTPGPGVAWILQSETASLGIGAGPSAGFGWRHLVVERSGGEVTFYASGFNIGRQGVAEAQLPNVTNSTLRIGTWAAGAGLPMMGVIDDVAIWNRALTYDERTYLGTHATPAP